MLSARHQFECAVAAKEGVLEEHTANRKGTDWNVAGIVMEWTHCVLSMEYGLNASFHPVFVIVVYLLCADCLYYFFMIEIFFVLWKEVIRYF